MTEHVIETVEELRSSYGEPSERAVRKSLERLDRHCRRFIALSPFVVLASAGADGRVDCSPRGDPAGFVAVLDDRTILLPDRRGNNRADSLTNVLENPHVGMLFLIPGVDETLRLNGRATLTTDPALLEPLAVKGRVPRSGLVVEVEEVFLQCTKALVRSRLWADETRVDRKAVLPSFGQMLADHIGEADGERVDREIRARVPETLY
ncbi:MAG: pyridoxamine 5'-phosphate oxidase family protein [Immundisolibacterales bacterium]|nr:pyridoxamine 5'-phosphate oxidase family protein [Immundisolibacterales bacterium]